MTCSECKREIQFKGQWNKTIEAKAVAEGWWFWDRNGPVEQLGHALCPDHNDRVPKLSTPSTPGAAGRGRDGT